MKKYWILAVIGLLLSSIFVTFGQVPQLMNYQAVLRDSMGSQLQNETVDLKISLLKGSIQGDVVFSEVHPVVTSNMGLIHLQIGAGDPLSGSLSEVDWGSDVFFLNVAVGLDDPVEKLHVNGNIKTEDTLKFKGLTMPGYSESIPGQILIGPVDIKIGFAYDNLGNILIGISHFGKTVFDLSITDIGNVGIGTDVFHETTTASENVCLGMYSGYNLSSGSENIFIGFSAGEHIADGYRNICLGNRAGYAWEGGGSNNIILGNYAGFAYSADNSGNIFIGNNAGYEVTTNNNIFIGPENTGRWSTGTKNIFLGYETGQNFSGSNTLLIDNNNDNTTPFIRGDLENDQLEINAQVTVTEDMSLESLNAENTVNLKELTDYPSNPEEGDLIYLNDTFRFYTGIVWRNLW